MYLMDEKRENPFGINLTKRYVSEAAEELLYKKFSIGNSCSVELVDYMGGDESVERVSTAGYGREIFSENPEQKEFINYLSTNGIYQSFRSVQFKFSVQA